MLIAISLVAISCSFMLIPFSDSVQTLSLLYLVMYFSWEFFQACAFTVAHIRVLCVLLCICVCVVSLMYMYTYL